MATEQEILRRFELAPELPSGLRNKITTNSRAKAGDMAGSFDGRYYSVRVQGKNYKTTHIIAMLADLPRWRELRANCKAGKDVALVVDHIDGNALNNAPSNLRIISNRENILAGYSTKQSTSKYVGVSLSTRDGKWKASIRCPETKMNIGLGTYEGESEAHQAYLKAAKKLYPFDDSEIRNI